MVDRINCNEPSCANEGRHANYQKRNFLQSAFDSIAIKLVTLIVLCLMPGMAISYTNGYRQDITINETNVSLQTVFKAIERQSEYKFFYNETLLQRAGKVSINVKNVSLQEALNVCFKNQPLTFAIVEKTIIVKKREDIKTTLETPIPPRFAKLPFVKGTVTSDSGPVAGASVTEKGTKNGASTNINGEFTLSDVEENAILVISSVSHEAKEVFLGGKTEITVALSTKINQLDEQVVVAYNITTTRRNTGSVTIVKGEEVRTIPNRSIDKSLQGLVPGLLVTSGSGQPGSGLSNFVLRGIATGDNNLNGSTLRNPLIVVDGIPVTQDFNQLYIAVSDVPINNPMAQLNPSDIETISVLKDAAAIALYGSKASNGVILITTKRGKAGKTVFSFRNQTDFAKRLEGKIKLLNQQEYLDLLFETYRNSIPGVTDDYIRNDLKTIFPTKADGSFYAETNLFDEVYNNHATTFSNELAISGGNEKTNYYLNLEYTKQNGVFRKTGYDRKSVRFNFENRPTSWFRMGTNTALSYNTQDYASLGGDFPYAATALSSPLNPVYDEKGQYILNFNAPLATTNPIAAMEYNSNQNISYRGLSKLYAELSIFKYFKFTSSLGADFILTESKEKFDPRLFDTYTYSTGSGRIQERETRSANLINTNTMRFENIFSGKHFVNILAGQESQILTQKFLEGKATNLRFPGYNQVNNGSTRDADGNSSKQTLLSYFGQANYAYNNKYLLSLSVRKDGSSKFGDNQRFGTYWSAGAGWIITEESFMSGARSWLNYLKIRGSIGDAGNSGAIDRFTRYDKLSAANFYGDPNNNIAVFPLTQPANLDIKWEETFTWDAGIEGRFWNERIAVSGDIYHRKTSDLIYLTNIAFVTGYGSVLDNIGDMENKGIELSLSIDILKNKDFTWNIVANWSTNQNKLLKANVPLAAISGNTLANAEGRNFNSFYLPVWAGVNPADGLGQWVDSTGKPNSNYGAAKRQFVGKPQPDGFGAITNVIRYKNFELSALFYYQYGFEIFNSYTFTNDGSIPYANQDRRALNRWQKAGDVAENPKRTLYNSDGSKFSTRYLYDGDYISLQNITLAYTLPKLLTNRLHVNMVRVFAQGHNLATWTKFPGGNPNDAGVQGSVRPDYPNQKVYSLGINVDF